MEGDDGERMRKILSFLFVVVVMIVSKNCGRDLGLIHSPSLSQHSPVPIKRVSNEMKGQVLRSVTLFNKVFIQGLRMWYHGTAQPVPICFAVVRHRKKHRQTPSKSQAQKENMYRDPSALRVAITWHISPMVPPFARFPVSP